MKQDKRLVLKREGKVVFTSTAKGDEGYNECWLKLQRCQSQSCSRAIETGEYSIEYLEEAT